MTPRTLCRAAVLPLLGAALLSACTDRVPTSPAAAPLPEAPRLTVLSDDSLVTLNGGENFACALASGGQAWCWGRNAMGNLGDSTAATRTYPVAVHQGSGVTFTKLSSTQWHSCAITSAGQAWCWGSNGDSRLGDSTTNLGLAPVAVKPLGGVAFATIEVGGDRSCGLTSAGQAYCWGGNGYGALGNNSTAFRKTPVAVQHPSGVTFTTISPGSMHTCAVDTTGQAWCWGYGADGAMGSGFSLGDSIPVAVTQPSGVTFTSLTTEYSHTCALTAAGQAYCWGQNGGGQLGDNTTTTAYTPVAVQQPSGVTFTALTTGPSHTCGLTSGGQVYCWGSNTYGQLGDGTTTQRKTPVAVSQPSGVTFNVVTGLSSGSTCAVDTTGKAWCWGRNNYRQLGNGTTTNSSSAVAVVIDAQPVVTSTTPAHGAVDVSAANNLVINFSEAVSVSGSSFSLSCTTGTQTFSVSGSGTSTVNLDPVNLLPPLDTCTVTVFAAQVTDADSVGASVMDDDYVFSFTVASEFGGDP